jgi:ribosomal protein L20
MIPKKLVLELAKGFRGRSKNCISIARERVEKALQYAYRFVKASNHAFLSHSRINNVLNFLIPPIFDYRRRDRRVRRRDLRSQWIQQINAGTILTLSCSCSNFIDRSVIIDLIAHSNAFVCTGSREHGLKYQQLVHGLNIAGNIICYSFHALSCRQRCFSLYYCHNSYD